MLRYALTTQITSVGVHASLVSLVLATTLSACASDAPTDPSASSHRSEPIAAVSSKLSVKCALVAGQLPDLVVTSIHTGPPTSAGVVPVGATIKNIGSGCAGLFRIEGQEWMSNGLFAARLDVDPTTVVDASGSTLRYIEPGETVTISGRITLPFFAHNELAVFNILADGCTYVGDEFLPTSCRVAESREDNNMAQAIVKIP